MPRKYSIILFGTCILGTSISLGLLDETCPDTANLKIVSHDNRSDLDGIRCQIFHTYNAVRTYFPPVTNTLLTIELSSDDLFLKDSNTILIDVDIVDSKGESVYLHTLVRELSHYFFYHTESSWAQGPKVEVRHHEFIADLVGVVHAQDPLSQVRGFSYRLERDFSVDRKMRGWEDDSDYGFYSPVKSAIWSEFLEGKTLSQKRKKQLVMSAITAMKSQLGIDGTIAEQNQKLFKDFKGDWLARRACSLDNGLH